MRIKLLLILILSSFVLVLSTSPTAAQDPQGISDVEDAKPAITFDSQGKGNGGRLMAFTDGPVTEDMLGTLSEHGKVHLVVQNYQMVSITPKGNNGAEDIEGLDFVTQVSDDHRLYLNGGVGSWWTDMVNAVEMFSSSRDQVDGLTGEGVYVAVIDSGFIPDWRDWLDEDQVATEYARSFIGRGNVDEAGVPADPKVEPVDPPGKWEKDTNSHGTAVAAYIIGYKVSPTSENRVDGVAPDAKIIPLKTFPNGESGFHESQLIAALDYVTSLSLDGPLVISMSLSGREFQPVTEIAINNAIASGAILVSSAGNEGEEGMGWPGALEQMISVGNVGYTRQWRHPAPNGPEPFDGFWQLMNVDEGSGTNDPNNPDAEAAQAFVASSSSRAIPDGDPTLDQELDVLAPGNLVRAPYGHPKPAVQFQGGTSFSTPIVAGIVALMLEKNPNLEQNQGPGGGVQAILKSSTDPMLGDDERTGVLNLDGTTSTYSWDTDCNGKTCDPVGAGLIQADEAIANTP